MNLFVKLCSLEHAKVTFVEWTGSFEYDTFKYKLFDRYGDDGWA